MDWIDDIVENTYRNYKKRKIVLWGKYGASEEIKDRLKDKYGIETAFYVDKDISKIDNKQVFPTEILKGKSDEYYVVVPVAYYKSLKDELTGGGYEQNKDYYYFCDCIVEMRDGYYEDSHMNKIIGPYRGLKFAFSGFNSVVKIGENVSLRNSCFYIHSDVEIEIGSECEIKDSLLHADGAHIEVGSGCKIMENIWGFKKESQFRIGNGGCFRKGNLSVGEKAQFIIGKDFSINSEYHLCASKYTQIIIGNDVMCSYYVALRSNDGHTIFDVRTGENINSTEKIGRNRKIVIGNHVWIGMRTIILYDTVINDGSIIGAGSLVKGKIPNNCIVAGIPAKIVKKDIAWSRNECVDELMQCERAYAQLTE